MHFGIKVKRITLLPIGGVASMSSMPKKPFQELVIALAGPLSNILVILVFYFPLLAVIGKDSLMHAFFVLVGQAKYDANFNILAYIYWLNLMLAGFNLIPAFPMDGGRVLRALLSYRVNYKKATDIAVSMGHIFALFFAYIGIVYGHIFLIIIAVFIYMAASGEGLQVDVQETIKSFSVIDILAKTFISVPPDARLSKVLELAFHSHQEDFPVIEEGVLKGFLTRKLLIHGIHIRGKEAAAGEIMRTDIPPVKITTKLHEVQRLMQRYNTGAMPVVKNSHVVGVVTIDDINRVYVMLSEKW
jgi:Zn-dependent protease/CBS domain-containing protein